MQDFPVPLWSHYQMDSCHIGVTLGSENQRIMDSVISLPVLLSYANLTLLAWPSGKKYVSGWLVCPISMLNSE